MIQLNLTNDDGETILRAISELQQSLAGARRTGWETEWDKAQGVKRAIQHQLQNSIDQARDYALAPEITKLTAKDLADLEEKGEWRNIVGEEIFRTRTSLKVRRVRNELSGRVAFYDLRSDLIIEDENLKYHKLDKVEAPPCDCGQCCNCYAESVAG